MPTCPRCQAEDTTRTVPLDHTGQPCSLKDAPDDAAWQDIGDACFAALTAKKAKDGTVVYGQPIEQPDDHPPTDTP